MSVYVDNAIVTRWNAVAALTAIGTLVAGQITGNPEETALPRTNFWCDGDVQESESVNTRVKLKTVTIEHWGSSKSTVGTNIATVKAKMLDAQKSGTSPLQIVAAQGAILSTHHVDEGLEKVADAVWRGWYQFLIRYRETKAVP